MQFCWQGLCFNDRPHDSHGLVEAVSRFAISAGSLTWKCWPLLRHCLKKESAHYAMRHIEPNIRMHDFQVTNATANAPGSVDKKRECIQVSLIGLVFCMRCISSLSYPCTTREDCRQVRVLARRLWNPDESCRAMCQQAASPHLHGRRFRDGPWRGRRTLCDSGSQDDSARKPAMTRSTCPMLFRASQASCRLRLRRRRDNAKKPCQPCDRECEK